jgi:hypothetical protein
MGASVTAQAQSVLDSLPSAVQQDEGDDAVSAPEAPAAQPTTPMPAPTDPYTVADVNADVTADHAGHARDQALAQAERAAFVQLCGRLGVAPERASKFSDDDIAILVQSFDLQSERLSSVRYIGVFTIHFKQAAVQKKLGKFLPATAAAAAHLTVTVQTPTLASWTQIKRRLSAVPQTAKIDVLDLGRGITHINLAYTGSIDALQQAVTAQGLVLRQVSPSDWLLTDGSMVPR